MAGPKSLFGSTIRNSSGKLLISRSRAFLFLLAVSSLLLQFQWLQKSRVASEEVNERATSVLEGYVTTGTTSKKKKTFAQNVNGQSRQLRPDDYMTDLLCGGCRWTYDHRTKKTCGKIIAARMKRDKELTLADAAQTEIDLGSTDCQKCLECHETQHHRYWRPDRTAPTIQHAVSHYLQSIPHDFRIPLEQLEPVDDDEKLANYLRQYPASPTSGRTYLFEYNPAIVQYQPTTTTTQPSQPSTLQIKGETPAYIASYRVSNQQACFHTNVTQQLIGGDWSQRPETISYLGIALLRHNLSIIADGVFDPPVKFGSRDDFRLFWLPQDTSQHKSSNNSNSPLQLYMTTGRRLTPLWIGTKEQPPSQMDPKIAMELPAKFPRQTILKIHMGKYQLKASEDLDAKGVTSGLVGSAKNLNYFVDANGTTQVEWNPPANSQSQVKPHMVQPVHLNVQDCTGYKKKPTVARYNFFNDSVTTTVIPQHQSFYTMEELEFANGHEYYQTPYTPDRGGTCCLPLTHPNDDGRQLLVGISHVKVPFLKRKKLRQMGTEPNQYLSRFYAFEGVSPYNTVAISGYFCFGQFLGKNNNNNNSTTMHPLAKRPPAEWFKMSQLSLDCPVIHFISGMTEKAGDPSKIIITYGVQDCTAWFVEVNKQEIVDLLFKGPTRGS
ncbi:Inherit from COG: Hemolysin-type calcium-binding [Seminavis robusta]|uniref:Inherit from COG: Hemolysin-type calcium-binding n=1 Tax=Seminavis robusta TaxID=568900 RepID=A0A9N8HAU0_9STRA|nr:Inherit from COG: Hemolysin-type calcium-binding [Seminavis robusta]|eukprot:Sro238_g095460.1 Inherit from COG: Hemolysin-type calcium-binding (664) ;mRNA; f:16872-18863